MYLMDSIESVGMTLSMKLMRMCGWSGFAKTLLNPKSEVRGMYFGMVSSSCWGWGFSPVVSKVCANGCVPFCSIM